MVGVPVCPAISIASIRVTHGTIATGACHWLARVWSLATLGPVERTV